MSNHATPEGTTRYANRLASGLAETHFTEVEGLLMSSIGIGTYLGNNDADTDGRYTEAVLRAAELGCNHIDTAINYRFQRSERSVGRALEELLGSGTCARDELIVATKGGYIPFDGAPPPDIISYFVDTFIKPRVVSPDDIVAGCHCIAPGYIEHQITSSLENLGLECIDIYYLHNPEEQLQEISREKFMERLAAAFELLERMVDEGKIRFFGVATWNGLIDEPGGRGYLPLEDMVETADGVSPGSSHFRFIQLPVNLAMLDAVISKNQTCGGTTTTVLEAAWSMGVHVVASSSLLQSRLTTGLPDDVTRVLAGLDTDAQRAIQFTRSCPGVASALVGMSSIEHVAENMRVAALDRTTGPELATLFNFA